MQLYFAAPLFSQAERDFNKTVCERLEADGHSVFLPQRDGIEGLDAVYEREGIDSHEDAMNEIFRIDREAVLEADVLVAVLDGLATDEGVAAEMAIAYEHDIPVVALDTDLRVFADGEPHNAMVFGPTDRIVDTPERLRDAVVAVAD